jgi:hypothetical protein
MRKRRPRSRSRRPSGAAAACAGSRRSPYMFRRSPSRSQRAAQITTRAGPSTSTTDPEQLSTAAATPCGRRAAITDRLPSSRRKGRLDGHQLRRHPTTRILNIAYFKCGDPRRRTTPLTLVCYGADRQSRSAG